MFNKIGFHEATVAGLKCIGTHCYFWLEGVTQVNESCVTGCLVLNRVSSIYVDDSPVTEIGMEAEDGEVIDLECTGTELNAIVQWNNFAVRDKFLRHYRLVFDSAEWKTGSDGTGSPPDRP